MESVMKSFISFNIISLIIFSFHVSVNAQSSGIMASISAENAREGQSVKIAVELYQTISTSNITLFYRPFGKSEFLSTEMLLAGKNAVGIIPKEYVSAPYIEYYLKISFTNGNDEVYPFGAPLNANPLQLVIEAKPLQDKEEEIIFLSPLLGESITPDNFFLSISLLRVDPAVNRHATKIHIDETDITSIVMFTEDLLLLPPENLPFELSLGKHKVQVTLFDTSGAHYQTSSLFFTIISKEFEIISAEEKFNYKVNLQGESRHENLRNVKNSFNRFSANLSGAYDWIRSNVQLYITSEEKPDVQPQNRYLINVETDWLKFGYGDNYPKFPSLIMDGKRLRGFSGALTLGFINVQTVYGEINRSVEGRLIEPIARKDYPNYLSDAIVATNIIPIDSAKYGQPFGKVGLATFKRNLFAVRPYFGKGENFQLGFSYLHSKDEISSVEFGARPKENVVLGSDLTIGIDNQRILFNAQAAFSLMNNDISTGEFSDALIDSLFGEGKSFGGDPEEIKKLRDIAGKFITVNQFISPLNPQELPTLAAEATLGINYFNNYLKASYIYRGNEFISFGQNFARNDIRGINIYDRIGLIQNRLFISLGYEKLQDNLQKTKIATTTFNNLSASISIFPRIDFPNITLGYSSYSINNDINPLDPDTLMRKFYVEDVTNRFSFSSSYDFSFLLKNKLSLSVLISDRDDKSVKNSDAKFTAVMLNLQNQWNIPLTTFFSTSINNSEISNSKFDYFSISIGGKYRLLSDKLELSAILNPSFGDFQRQVFEVGTQYYFISNLSLNFQFRYFLNKKPAKDETIIALTSRYEI